MSTTKPHPAPGAMFLQTVTPYGRLLGNRTRCSSSWNTTNLYKTTVKAVFIFEALNSSPLPLHFFFFKSVILLIWNTVENCRNTCTFSLTKKPYKYYPCQLHKALRNQDMISFQTPPLGIPNCISRHRRAPGVRFAPITPREPRTILGASEVRHIVKLFLRMAFQSFNGGLVRASCGTKQTKSQPKNNASFQH